MSIHSSTQPQWYLKRQNQQLGPYSLKQLLKFKQMGKLNPEDAVLEVGETEWVLAKTIPGLFHSAETMTRSRKLATSTLDQQSIETENSGTNNWPTIPNYTILDLLGQGGMGVVYKAKHQQLDRLVALKILPVAKTSASALERFQREARILAKLEHPNIVRVYEVGEHKGQPYIALELITGGDLADYLLTKQLDIQTAVGFIEKLARAVHMTHQQGIIHRDLKPSNILLTKKGQLKITDFGIAKEVNQTSQQTQVGSILGTPGYMAPEQASRKGDPIDAKTDVYALGAILYQLLCGEPPFSGPAEIAVYHVLHTKPKALRDLNAEVPLELEKICLRCLAKKPGKRFDSALQLAEALNDFRNVKTMIAPGYGNNRWWLLPAIAGASILCIILVLLLLIRPSNGPSLSQGEIQPHDKPTPIPGSKQNNLAPSASNENEKLKLQLTEKKQERTAYLLKIQQAQTALLRGEKAQAEALFNQCQLAHRHWEWHYLNRNQSSSNIPLFYDESLRTLSGHSKAVRGVVFSPDGKRIVSRSDDFKIKVWDAETGKLIHTLEKDNKTFTIHGISFSPDGKHIVSSSYKTVKLWDIEAGTQILTLEGHKKTIYKVGFTLDGKHIISEGDGIKVWALTVEAFSISGKEVLTINGRSIKVHQDGSNPTNFILSDSKTGKILRTLTIFNKFRGEREKVVYSADGEKKVSIDSSRKTIIIHDKTNPKPIYIVQPHKNYIIHSVAFSPNGKRIASGSTDKTIKLWDAKTGDLLRTLQGHRSEVNGVTFSPNGKLIVSAAENIKIWDATTSNQQSVTEVTLSINGQHLASTNTDRSVIIWDAKKQQQLYHLTEHLDAVNSVAISPDDQTVATASDDQTIKIWNLKTGKLQRTLTDKAAIRCVRFSPDKTLLASGSTANTITLQPVSSGKTPHTLKGHQGTVRSIAFSSNGARLISGSDDTTIRLWDLTNKKEIRSFTGHTAPVSCVVFSPNDAFIISGSEDKTICIWDVKSGELVQKIIGHRAIVTSVSISPDGERLASASEDGTIKLWDVLTGQEALTFRDHQGAVHSVKFSRNGQYLISGGMNHEVRIWDCKWAIDARAGRTFHQFLNGN